jgi:hypothetical protein
MHTFLNKTREHNEGKRMSNKRLEIVERSVDAERLIRQGKSSEDASIIMEMSGVPRDIADEAVSLAWYKVYPDKSDYLQSADAKSVKLNAMYADGIDYYEFNDILFYTPNPDNYIAGDGLIRRGAATLLTGGTGIGKSVLTAQVTIAAASGQPLLGCIKIRQPVPVFHIQAENDAETMQRDFCSAVKFSDADPKLVQKNLSIFHAYGKTGAEFGAWLSGVIRQMEHAPGLIVVDPYQSFAGANDFNNTTGFLEWHRPIQAMIQRYNMALLLVAHTPKPQDREHWNVRESVYMAAGTSALANWVRASMELCTLGKEVDRFCLRFGKNAERNGLVDRDGRTIRELYIQHSHNPKEPFWCVAEDQNAPSNSQYKEQIMELAVAHPSMTYQEIADELGCSKGTVCKHYPKAI